MKSILARKVIIKERLLDGLCGTEVIVRKRTVIDGDLVAGEYKETKRTVYVVRELPTGRESCFFTYKEAKAAICGCEHGGY